MKVRTEAVVDGTLKLNGGEIIQVPDGSTPVTLTVQIEPKDVGLDTPTRGIGSFEYFAGQHVGISAGRFVACPKVIFSGFCGTVIALQSTIRLFFQESAATLLGRLFGLIVWHGAAIITYVWLCH